MWYSLILLRCLQSKEELHPINLEEANMEIMDILSGS